LSKRWFTAARCHRSLAKPAVTASRRLSWVLDLKIPESTYAFPVVRMLVVIGVIAAAGRSGVEEMYCVLYLDVGCDVCCHVA
jgi:hypothetical protein